MSPLRVQYLELKAQAKDAILLFRLGDFYEFFDQDAIDASQILGITLTSRDKTIPMAGIPHNHAQAQIQKLLFAGRKVAICEQMELPQKGALVRREIVRILTPGIQIDHEHDQAYLGAIIQEGEHHALAFLETSTGELLIDHGLSLERLCERIRQYAIKHVLTLGFTLKLPNILNETLPINYITKNRAQELLCEHYDIGVLDALFPRPGCIIASAAAVLMVLRTQRLDRLTHLHRPSLLKSSATIDLREETIEHLDLPHLFKLINKTETALGARRLKYWLYHPFRQSAKIHEQQEAVKDCVAVTCTGIMDLERLAGKLAAKLTTPRDTYALGQSLLQIEALKLTGSSAAIQRLSQTICDAYQQLRDVGAWIRMHQKADAPTTHRDGGIFQGSAHPDLSELLRAQDTQALLQLEEQEIKNTGIPTLKVRSNRIYGYYIEITKSQLKNIPTHYERKQTLSNGERFTTPELKALERILLTAEARQRELEYVLFEELLMKIAINPLMQLADALSELDALSALSRMLERNWVFPTIDTSTDLIIDQGRHPLVEQSQQSFTPNSIQCASTTFLITGPNMGGKSTFMRQIGLIVLLGHIGSPVPARSAHFGAVSSFHTRIGAQDALERGQSTFMVEMTELARILHEADEHSLIIIDEIGRGTSTYDGLSVAWASLEWLVSHIRARTLFATHYHELTSLPGIINVHMHALDIDGKLKFSYKLEPGPALQSFGIQVADLAGLPKPVINRAWQILGRLDKKPRKCILSTDTQLSLF